MAFLCDGAAAADGANAQLLRDGAAAVAPFIGDGDVDVVAFLCDGSAAAVVLLRVLRVAIFEHDDEN